MGDSRYTPDGINAMARQHPKLIRDDGDKARMSKAAEKAKRKAKRRAKLAAEPAPTRSPGKEFGGAEQRRLQKRARGLYNG
jgi:hypothetical protein